MLDLEPIKARLKDLPKDPWEDMPWEIVAIDGEGGEIKYQVIPFGLCNEPRNIRTFIAHARSDVPALVAEVEVLRETLAEAADIIIEELRNELKQQTKIMKDIFDLPETEL